MTPATDGQSTATNRPSFLPPAARAVLPAAPPPGPSPLGSSWAVALLVVLGIALDTRSLLQDRDLWIDEAMLALNLVGRGPRQLLEPLDWNQGAPVGFLLAVKAAIGMFGTREWVLRLVPFLGSVLGLIGFAVLSRRWLPAPAATLAVGLAAVSPYRISYAAECKQYATDWVLAVALLLVATGPLHRAGGWRRWAGLVVLGAWAVWFSHPAVFVLGGIGAALMIDAVGRREWKRAVACGAVIGCWLVSFAACYGLLLRHLGANAYLLDYWQAHFLPGPPTSPAALAWLADHYFALFTNPGGFGGGEWKASGVAAVVFLVGVAAFWRDRPTRAVALVVPGVLALVASALHKYPFAGRLLLFLLPLLVLGVARGAWSLLGVLRTARRPFAAALFLAVLTAAPALETLQNTRRPPRREQLGELLTELRCRVEPGDAVYLHWGAVPAFTFYTRNEPFPVPVVRGGEYPRQPTAYRDELRRLAGRPRVWVVFSHRHGSEESLLRAYSEGLGDRREELLRPGAKATCYDFRGRQ